MAAIVVALTIAALCGMFIERFFLRLLGQDTLAQVLVTIGFAFILQDGSLYTWGGDNFMLKQPWPLNYSAVVGGLSLPPSTCGFMIVIAVLVAAALFLGIERTRLGAIMRAAVDDPEMARGIGINTNVVQMSIFAIGALLAATGGVVGGAFFGVYPGLDFEILPYAFAVVIIGGLGSLGARFSAALSSASSRISDRAVARTLLFSLSRAHGHLWRSKPTACSEKVKPCWRPGGKKRVLIVLGVFSLSESNAVSRPFMRAGDEILVVGILLHESGPSPGFTGLASLGHAAYFGVASYTTAIIMTKEDWTWTFAAFQWADSLGLGLFYIFIFALVVATAFAAFFGFLAIRAVGVYFLMITLSLAMVIWGLAYRWSAVTEGDNGINVLGRPSLFGISLESEMPFFYFTLAVFLICLGLMYMFVRSPFGKTLVGIREREERMQMLGYNIWLHKYLAFIIAGVFSGVSGVMWTLFNLFVSPPDIELITSAEAALHGCAGGPATR